MGFLIPILQRLFIWVGSRLLVAFGLSFITYTGVTLSLNLVKNYVLNSMNNIPSDLFNLLMMAGFGQAIGIIFGAFAFKIGLESATKLSTSIAKKI